MSTSNQTYKELAIPYFRETFDCIDDVMRKLNIPYYLIGVNAIELELLKEGIKPGRGTKDIDFAVMISSVSEFESIIAEMEKKGFKKVAAPWTFYSEAYNLAVDILPFGEIEEIDRINFTNRHIDLHVLGFREVMEEAKQVEIEDKIAHIPPLPGMVILKLIAWSDRPQERQNDLSDIIRIIEHYFLIAWDEIAEKHFDILDQDTEDQKIFAAELLGRQSRMYLQKSEVISKRIQNVLDNNLQEAEKSAIAREWARKLDSEIEYAFTLLNAFQKGITHE